LVCPLKIKISKIKLLKKRGNGLLCPKKLKVARKIARIPLKKQLALKSRKTGIKTGIARIADTRIF